MVFKEAVLFITNRCNFNCYHCYVSKGSEEIPFEELLYFLDVCVPEFAIKRITLVGGEPLLYSRIIPLLDRFSIIEGIELIITTNGSVCNEKLLTAIKNSKIKLLKISLHSLDPSVYDKFTNTRGQYEKVLQNIDCFSVVCDLGINTTITASNVDELNRLIELCLKKKIRRLNISQLTLSGNGKKIEKEKLSTSVIAKIKNKLEKCKMFGLTINYDDHSICNFGKKLIVDMHGNIFPCPALISYPQYRIGHIRSPQKDNERKLRKLNSQRAKKCFVEEFIR